MSTVAIIGGANQVSAWLVPRLLSAGHDVIVLSRRARPVWIAEHRQLRWEVRDATLGVDVDALAYIAPLPLFGTLRGRLGRVGRYVAFSSTSAMSKARSPSEAERELAVSLVRGENAIRTRANSENRPCAILRPTLIYGAGLDRNLTRLAERARRQPLFPLVSNGCGLRSPVHANDLAILAERLLTDPGVADGLWALPGASRLTYRDMIEQVYLSVGRWPRFVRVPRPLVGAAASAARLLPGFQDLDAAMLLRMGEDLVFDDSDARRQLAWDPGAFEPTEETWAPPSRQAFSRL